MIAEGSEAPSFTLPAYEDGAVREVALSDYVGDDLVVLAFYPCDFSPLCTETACDVDTLDLFTMQKDVQVLAVSPDSTYSHARFAEAYDLTMPLLADSDGSVTREYGLCFEADHGEVLSRRAIVVINHDGEVEHVWSTTDLEEAFDIEAVREAISDVGSNATAAGRYRVGHAHYVEGRRAFTSAKRAYDERDWIIAHGDFDQAQDEFEEAADLFDTAERFVDAAHVEADVARAREKATLLWQAAEWLADSANSHASGASAQGEEYRQDAQVPLGEIQSLEEPPDPSVLLERIENGADGSVEGATETTANGDGDLGVDIDEVVEESVDATDSDGGDDRDATDDADEPESFIERADAAAETAVDEGGSEATAATEPGDDGSEDADEAEPVEELDLADPTEGEDTEEDGEEEVEELDLADPTEGDDNQESQRTDQEFGGSGGGDLDPAGTGGGSLGGSGGPASLDPEAPDGGEDSDEDDEDEEAQSGADPSGVPSWVED